MKLPHITIEYREETSFAVGKMSAGLVVGFGLHWAWVYLVMYNGLSLLGIADSPLSVYAFPASLVVFVVTFFCYGLFLKHARMLFNSSFQRQRNRLVAALMMVASIGFLYGTTLSGAPGVICVVLFGIVSGVGSAVLLMSFGVSFSVCDIPTASVSVALSLLVLVGVYGVVLTLNNMVYPLGVVVCVAIPLLELWCLARCSRQLVDNLEFQMLTLPVRKGSFGVRLLLPCLVLGMVLGVLRSRVLSYGSLSIPLGDLTLSIMLAGVAACLLIVLSMLTQRQTANFMFRTLFPLIALFLAVAVSPLAQNESFAIFVLFTAYIMLESCVWLLIVDISQKYRISAFLAFGFGRGASALGTLVVVAIKMGLPQTYATVADATTITIVLLVLLMLGYALVPSNSELRSILSKGKRCPAFAGQEGFAFANEAERESMPAMMQELSGAAVSPQVPTDQSSVSHFEQGVRMDNARAEDASDTTRQHADVYVSNDKSDHMSADRTIADDDVSSPERIGHYKRKCLAVANIYLLSRKETEVLFLLAKGHNSATIQKKLYISAGTANTHMRNIYRKLDIHSQQDLIALVESTVEEADM